MTIHWVGMDIFWNHTFLFIINIFCCLIQKHIWFFCFSGTRFVIKSTMPVCHNQCCLLDGFQVHSSLEDYLTSLVASVCCSQQSSLLLLLRLRVPLCLFSGKFTCFYWLLAWDSRGRHLTLAKRRLSNDGRNSILMTCITQILVVLQLK